MRPLCRSNEFAWALCACGTCIWSHWHRFTSTGCILSPRRTGHECSVFWSTTYRRTHWAGVTNVCQTTSRPKKALGDMQILYAGCSKAEPKNFAPPQTPFPGAWDVQNLISWRWSLPLPTNPIWRGSMHAISSYRGNRPTNTLPARSPVANIQTHRQDW